MFSRKTRPRATRTQALWLRAFVTGVLLGFCAAGGQLAITAAHAGENGSAVGEDLAVAELSALAAEWKGQQLAKGKISLPQLREAYLKDLQVMKVDTLATMRGICAAHRMPVVKRKVDSAEPSPVLPDVDVYCLKAIEISARRDRLSDLYINLALQEQGRSEFRSAEDAELLKNNEPSRTRIAIFKAADAGEAVYITITGHTRALGCPLALDTGYTWGYRNADKVQPDEFTAAEIATIARTCYDPSAKEMVVTRETLAASRAGLLAGAWLGRQFRNQNATHLSPPGR